MSAVYIATDRTDGPALWAGDDRNAALAWAQAHADALAVKRPGEATPHVVVQVWRDGTTRWQDDLHVYAERPTPTGEYTIDGQALHVGMHVWDYDLRPAVVGEVAHVAHGVTWYATTRPDGTRGKDFDASRMWYRHPSTGKVAS